MEVGERASQHHPIKPAVFNFPAFNFPTFLLLGESGLARAWAEAISSTVLPARLRRDPPRAGSL